MNFGVSATAVAMSAVFVMAMSAGDAAFALEPVQGPVILTVDGEIAHTNAPDAAEFDLAMLRDLDAVVIETSTIWTEGLQTFEGVELSSLLASVGAEGSILRAVALNDYAVDIPLSDAVAGGALVAYLRNGEEMSLRDKGPVWIVYPFDSSPEFQTEEIYSRSIWQLARIEVLP